MLSAELRLLEIFFSFPSLTEVKSRLYGTLSTDFVMHLSTHSVFRSVLAIKSGLCVQLKKAHHQLSAPPSQNAFLWGISSGLLFSGDGCHDHLQWDPRISSLQGAVLDSHTAHSPAFLTGDSRTLFPQGRDTQNTSTHPDHLSKPPKRFRLSILEASQTQGKEKGEENDTPIMADSGLENYGCCAYVGVALTRDSPKT